MSQSRQRCPHPAKTLLAPNQLSELAGCLAWALTFCNH